MTWMVGTVGNTIRRKLVFRDNLTEERFEYMRDHLAEALLSSDSVELELRDIGQIDETLIKLICGAHRVSDSLGKSFSLSTVETRSAVIRLAESTGYSRLPCCMRESGCLYGDNGTK